jgi:hypothetical protein
MKKRISLAFSRSGQAVREEEAYLALLRGSPVLLRQGSHGHVVMLFESHTPVKAKQKRRFAIDSSLFPNHLKGGSKWISGFRG